MLDQKVKLATSSIKFLEWSDHTPRIGQCGMNGEIAQGDQAADAGFRGGNRHRTGIANGAQIDNDVGPVGTVLPERPAYN
jgi:hypothetical protein